VLTAERGTADRARVLWLAVTFAICAALSYVLIGLHMLGVGDLGPDERPPGIIYVAAGCYLLGGLLILLRRRSLWIIGATINALVIVFFISMYTERPAVLFSPGGLISKAAQLLLEISLLYLIYLDWRRKRRLSAGAV
jgi:cytochrome c biogenesis protein CcdA